MVPHSRLRKATELAHDLIRERLHAGDTAIDATVGNGHDTEFLAKLVGSEGKVIGFDIQAEAIAATKTRVESFPWVSLHEKGHEGLEEIITAPVKTIMFNLGYLPSGDKAITTGPETTLTAIKAGSRILAPGGLMTITVYTGHEGGVAESEAVTEYVRTLAQEDFAVASYQFLNQRNSPPHLIAVEKRVR